MWDKKTVDMLGNGTIAAPADGYTILRDAAALARDPAALLPADAGAPPASDKVVAYGYSQTGGLLRGLVFRPPEQHRAARRPSTARSSAARGSYCNDLNQSE